MILTQPPKTKAGGARPKRRKTPPPKVATVDQVLFLLMENRNVWFAIVKEEESCSWGALGIALHRRGCEVEKLLGVVRARWTHEVPSVDSLVKVVRPAHPAIFVPKKKKGDVPWDTFNQDR